MSALHSDYKFIPERNEWLGVVYRRTLFGKKEVVTIGCMATEQGIKLWLAAYLRTGKEPADMYGEGA
jgi:hypothetical protein